MLKRLALAVLTVFLVSTACLASSKPADASDPKPFRVKVVPAMDIEYYWVLMDNGCYWLFQVKSVSSADGAVVLEWWTPMNAMTWAGSYVNCAFSAEEMETIC